MQTLELEVNLLRSQLDHCVTEDTDAEVHMLRLRVKELEAQRDYSADRSTLERQLEEERSLR